MSGISYSIDVDEAAVKDAVSAFEFVGGNIGDAMRIAINKSALKVKTLASREIRKQVRLSAAYVSLRLAVTKATRNRLSGAIKTPSRGVLLSRFSTDAVIALDGGGWTHPPPIPTRGIRIKIKPDGKTTGAPGVGTNKPFYIVLNKGQNVGIAARTGTDRKGIKVFSGPSLSQVFNTVRGDVLPAASSEYQAQLLDAMRYLLVKKYPPEEVT
jgi:hypothetical protein